METNFSMKGDYTHEIRFNAEAQVYRLRDFLLEGKRVTCDVARLKLDIGGSALPRRIKDCKDFLNMKIQAIWKPYNTARGIKTKVREYYMKPDDIEHYLLHSMDIKVKYVTTPGGKKSVASSLNNKNSNFQ